jgi:hypothetical protein
MEKLGVEPRTFSTQHVLLGTMLRRCHTARPYPRDQSSQIDGGSWDNADYHAVSDGKKRANNLDETCSLST